MVLHMALSRNLGEGMTRRISQCMVHMLLRRLSRIVSGSIEPIYVSFWGGVKMVNGHYLALCLAVTAAFSIMAFLGAPVIADTAWTITPSPALRMFEHFLSLIRYLETSPAGAATVVTAGENACARLRTKKFLRCDILETADLDFMSTLGNGFFDFDITFDGFQIVHLVTHDSIFDMTAGKLHVMDFRHARTTSFTA